MENTQNSDSCLCFFTGDTEGDWSSCEHPELITGKNWDGGSCAGRPLSSSQVPHPTHWAKHTKICFQNPVVKIIQIRSFQQNTAPVKLKFRKQRQMQPGVQDWWVTWSHFPLYASFVLMRTLWFILPIQKKDIHKHEKINLLPHLCVHEHFSCMHHKKSQWSINSSQNLWKSCFSLLNNPAFPFNICCICYQLYER